jgi:hypothetical protein
VTAAVPTRTQPWADVIVGDPVVIADGWWTAGELDDLEQAVIAGQWARVRRLADAEAARRGAVADLSGAVLCEQAGPRPRYNIADGGLSNPDHVPQWVAREQRWARDDAAGRVRWVLPERRVTVPVVPPAPPSWPGRLARRAGRALLRWLGRVWARVWPWLAGWATAFTATAVGLVWAGVESQDAAALGVAAATGLCAWVRSRRRPRKRRR